MKVGVFTVVLRSMKLDLVLDYLVALGAQALEIGAGGYAGTDHCPIAELLASERKSKQFLHAITSRGLSISALNCAGNPLHPNRRIAAAHDDAFRKAVRLAAKLGVDVVINFSGCPGDQARAKYPNWVTCPGPDYLEILNWQWTRVAFPYWARMAGLRKYGVKKIALEMHPGFVVYNRALFETAHCRRTRDRREFRSIHLFWQGIDPCAAIRALRGAIYHVARQRRRESPLEFPDERQSRHKTLQQRVEPLVDLCGRLRKPTQFLVRLCFGAAHERLRRRAPVEHEDSLMTPREGLEKGIRFLQGVIPSAPKGEVTGRSA
jgi:sugar phosphate isomerase/epimerase